MMRTRFLPYLLLASLFLSISCNNQDDGMDMDSESVELANEAEIELIMSAQVVLHDLEGLILNQIYLIENNDLTGEVSTHPIDFNYFSSIGSCANWLLDKDANVLVVDFGNGCEDLLGSQRSGKLTINYINGQNPIGNEISITLENFNLENLAIAGELKMTKTLDEPTQYEVGYTIELKSFVVTRSSTSVNFEGEREILFYDRGRGDGVLANRPADFFATNTISGSVSSLNFDLNASTSLNYSSECWLEGRKFPHRGIESLILDNTNYEIDYNANGSQNCNYIVKVSQAENSWNINLED